MNYVTAVLETIHRNIAAVCFRKDYKMRTIAPSCAICAKAKSRCVRLPGQEACDRCTRLQKECYTRAQSSRKQKSGKVTYVEILLCHEIAYLGTPNTETIRIPLEQL